MELVLQNRSRDKVKSLSFEFLEGIGEIRFDLIHQVLVWQIAQNRIPIAHTKQVSEVRGSTRKIYKQKGTGNARHGSNRRGQFRGGAVVFGPTKYVNYKTKLNKKVKKIALRHSLAYMIRSNSVLLLDNFSLESCKTRYFINSFSEAEGKKTLFVDDCFERNFLLASRNISNLKAVPSSGLNVRDIFDSKLLFITESGINAINERLR